MKRNYTMKNTISIKQFILEFGENFSKHTKQRLLELGTRCILTRKKDNSYILDLKHLEHVKYTTGEGEDTCQVEYAYGQVVMNEGELYFSKSCVETADVMQLELVNEIYSSLESDEMTIEEGTKVKKMDDSNIDYIIDNILQVCPEVSKEHKAILSKYIK